MAQPYFHSPSEYSQGTFVPRCHPTHLEHERTQRGNDSPQETLQKVGSMEKKIANSV